MGNFLDLRYGLLRLLGLLLVAHSHSTSLFLLRVSAISTERERSGETPVKDSFDAGQIIIAVITSARTGLSTVKLAEEMRVAKPSTCDSISLCLKYSTFLGLACSLGCLDPRVDLIAEKHHYLFPEGSRSVGPCFGMPKDEARRIQGSHRRPENLKSYNKKNVESGGTRSSYCNNCARNVLSRQPTRSCLVVNKDCVMISCMFCIHHIQTHMQAHPHRGGFYCVLGRGASAADPSLQPHSSATTSKPRPIESIPSGSHRDDNFLWAPK